MTAAPPRVPTESVFDPGTLVILAFAAVMIVFVVLVIRKLSRKRREELTEELTRGRELPGRKRKKREDESDEEAEAAEAAEAAEEEERAEAARAAKAKVREKEKEKEKEKKPDLRAVPEPAPEPEPVVAKKKKLEGKSFKEGLQKTRGGFISRIGKLLTGRKEIDEALLGQLEEVLFTADIGVKTAQKLFTALKQGLSHKELADPEKVWAFIQGESEKILDVKAPAIDIRRAKPFVILVIGVNGVGKTTTIGKLAARLHEEEDAKVVMAAGDTFRAAAGEQLAIWGKRAGAEVVEGKDGADPSSVIFDGIKRGKEVGADVVIADTAGRLHTKTNLMEELKKVKRVVQKAMDGAPHETFLVLDSTTGQNAIAQAQMFKQAMDITGIILTKMDGTAKGGVILGICDELQIPVRYVGIGERVEDLREFNPKEFAQALYESVE